MLATWHAASMCTLSMHLRDRQTDARPLITLCFQLDVTIVIRVVVVVIRVLVVVVVA